MIIGNEADEHVLAVLSELASSGCGASVVDAPRLAAAGRFLLTGDRFLLGDRDELVLDGRPRRGWIRRAAPEGWRDDVAPRSHDGAVRAAWFALLATLVRGFGIEWLTSPGTLASAENKALQYVLAARAGVDVPKTVVTTDASDIPPELGEQLVVKPLGPGGFVGTSTAGRWSSTQTESTATRNSELLPSAPFLVQELVRAGRHLRVATVGDRAWVCALTVGAPLDWRRLDEAHRSFSAVEHRDASSAALQVSALLGVGYSSQDWIETSDRLVFLDLNPGGQWLFLPEAVSRPVTAAIAAWLSRA